MTLSMFILLYLWVGLTSTYAHVCPRYCECDDNVTRVYCYTGSLNTTHFYKILQQLPVNIVELHISAPSNKSNFFKWNDNLNRLTNLRKLSLINCNIPAISQRLRIRSLVSLNLQHNKIETLQMDSFNGIHNLETLELSYNKISILPSGCFVFLKNLKSLSVSHNPIKDLPSNFLHGPKQVQKLELDGLQVPIDQLNQLLETQQNLERLELNFCSIDDTKVSRLWLHKVPKIVRFGLGGNNLTTIPSHKLRDLPHLQTVDLSYNKIRKVNACAFCSCNITTIYLGHNLLGIDDVSLNVESFAHVKVETLDLSFNFFDNFHSDLLGRARYSIKSLDLSGNTLTVPKSAFIEKLPNLRELHLASNHLEVLPSVWPIEYSSLIFLNLSHNYIKHVPSSFSHSFPFLKTLDISNNEINYLDSHLTTFLTEMTQTIYLDNNPWDCSCADNGIQKYFKLRRIISPRTELTLCAYPEEVKNLPVHKVSKISDCALLFGGSYQLTQLSELGILLATVVGLATVTGCILFICISQMRKSSKLQKSHAPEARTPFAMDAITLPLKNRFKDEEMIDLPPPLQPLTTFRHV